jgi:hypothetical protein
MTLYLDKDTRQFRKSVSSAAVMPSLILKRGDDLNITLQFVSGFAVATAGSGATGKLAIKAEPADANFLALAASWTAPGEGQTAYTFALDLFTDEMEAAFAAEPDTISAVLEIEWITSTETLSSVSLPVTVQNHVIRGTEGTPSEATDLKATQAEAEAGSSNEKWMTPLRVFQYVAKWWTDLTVPFSKLSSTPTTLQGYGITGGTVTSNQAGGSVLSITASNATAISGASSANYGLYGESVYSAGVYGAATEAAGVAGESINNAALAGDSVNGPGVDARSDSTHALFAQTRTGDTIAKFFAGQDEKARINSNGTLTLNNSTLTLSNSATLSGTNTGDQTGGTFSDNCTLNGTANAAPNQTAASGSSLMTRDLVDDRGIWRALNWNWASFPALALTSPSTSGTGAAVTGTGIYAPSTAGYARASFLSITYLQNSGSYSGELKLSVPFLLSAKLTIEALTAGITFRLLISESNAYTSGEPTNDAFGFKIAGTSASGFVHNGSTISYTSPITLTGSFARRFSIYGDGTNINFYVNSTFLGALPNPPGVGGSMGGTAVAYISGENDGSAVSTKYCFVSLLTIGSRNDFTP